MDLSLFGDVSAGLILAIWIYLALGRGLFWLARERDGGVAELPTEPPAVVAIVPARDEAVHIAASITSLLAQQYPGPFLVVLVDDQSRDGTEHRAQAAAHAMGAG